MGVLDSSILVNAAIAKHPDSVQVKVVGAAIGGLYVCVLSESIREETMGVLPKLGLPTAQVEEMYAPLWKVAVWVPLGAESDQYVRIVKDPDDVHVLRAGMGLYESRPELGDRKKFLVSDNTHHFRPDRNIYGFRFMTANLFWLALQAADMAEEVS